MSARPHDLSIRKLFLAVAALISGLLCFSAFAQNSSTLDDFVWARVKATGEVVALSRNDPVFNYFDIGDLAPKSLPIVQTSLGRLAKAAGLTIQHTANKSSSIAIIHDTNVFTRLKNDKQAFRVLGVPDDIIDDLKGRLVDDIKCLTSTRSDNEQNIFLTVVLLSEEADSHGCMISGLIDSFGVRAHEIDDKSLLNTCILYEGRRIGFRDRDNLSQKLEELRDRCMARLDRK